MIPRFPNLITKKIYYRWQKHPRYCKIYHEAICALHSIFIVLYALSIQAPPFMSIQFDIFPCRAIAIHANLPWFFSPFLFKRGFALLKSLVFSFSLPKPNQRAQPTPLTAQQDFQWIMRPLRPIAFFFETVPSTWAEWV